jgi:hypothetical protein
VVVIEEVVEVDAERIARDSPYYRMRIDVHNVLRERVPTR